MMMIQSLKLRAIYALHMLAPLAFVHWHMAVLSRETLQALSQMFPPG